MAILGHVYNGVVVFDQAVSLPEGTSVHVEPVVAPVPAGGSGWDAAMQAASELENYDFDACRKQREYDLLHAADPLP